MPDNPRIVFQVGGPDFHPVDDQARQITDWLGAGYRCERHERASAFDHLDGCDLLVLMGLDWTGRKEQYQPLTDQQKAAFERYVASGRPLLAHHGGVASYDDWPRYGELIGFTWIWGTSGHGPVAEYDVTVRSSDHPIVAGLGDFRVFDEAYYDIRVNDDIDVQTHAHVHWDGRDLPIVMTGEGGRIDGAGKTAWLGLGHDLRAFEAPAMRTLWCNAVRWALTS